MSFNQRDLEIKDRIIRNTTKSLMWADKQKRDEKLALVAFMSEIGKVFIYIAENNKRDIVLTYVPETLDARRRELQERSRTTISEEEYEELTRLESTLFVNINFLISAEDATPRATYEEKAMLSRWVTLLVDRLRSRTRRKRTIALIITEMFLQFMTCYSQHRRKTYAIYDMLMMAVETMSTEASKALLEFLENDAQTAFRATKDEARKAKDKTDKLKSV